MSLQPTAFHTCRDAWLIWSEVSAAPLGLRKQALSPAEVRGLVWVKATVLI